MSRDNDFRFVTGNKFTTHDGVFGYEDRLVSVQTTAREFVIA